MSRLSLAVGLFCVVATLPWTSSLAQSSGSRGGVSGRHADAAPLPRLERKEAESLITIEGTAEVRIAPTEIRVVLAATSEGETAAVCREGNDELVGKLKQRWTTLKIPAEKVVTDFIAVLPIYEWDIQDRGGKQLGVEKKSGYRMQTNVHLAVPNEALAQSAIRAAFSEGVTDIIAFDYWSDKLDDTKQQARAQAIAAAKAKSDLLLGALFEKRPPAINLQEQTRVHFPSTMYESFENSYGETATLPSRRDIPFLRAYRPRNTYYRGFFSDGDTQPNRLPMKPELSVVSTIRLYFESPAAARRQTKNEE